MTIWLRGMLGVGDCIHQRAVLREMLNYGRPVVLDTFYRAMYHDLVDHGLTLQLIGGHPPRIRERSPLRSARLPVRGSPVKITYNADMIHKHGSILAAQFASAGLQMPARPDFSLPMRPEWRQWAREAVGKHDKPLLVYRPIVLNNVWRSEARAPDPALYSALFRSIRDQFHVVSVANLGNSGEHIIGEEQDADVRFNRGELDFETMAGLFAEADLAFTCPGVSPVLAQAVGTKTVIVYGANECHRTTGTVGDHLAPTLAIEPDEPCDHHAKNCSCSKHISLTPAFERLGAFACVS